MISMLRPEYIQPATEAIGAVAAILLCVAAALCIMRAAEHARIGRETDDDNK